MLNKNNLIKQLSKHLFWEVDIAIVDEQKHKKYIVKQVLLYGSFDDWKMILKYYGLDKIINISKTIKDLDKKTLSFLSMISGVAKSDFLCYTTEQSIPKHWNF